MPSHPQVPNLSPIIMTRGEFCWDVYKLSSLPQIPTSQTLQFFSMSPKRFAASHVERGSGNQKDQNRAMAVFWQSGFNKASY